MTMQQLEELWAQLLRAQRTENAYVRQLNALILASPSDRTSYDRLAEQCHAARLRSTEAYDEWSKAVARYGAPTQQAPVGDGQSPEV